MSKMEVDEGSLVRCDQDLSFFFFKENERTSWSTLGLNLNETHLGV